MKWHVTYYSQQVAEGLRDWPTKMRAKYLRTIDLVEEYGPQFGSIFTKSLKQGLFEIRIKAQEGIGRAFFCYLHGNEIVILHTFVKKQQKTPKKDLELAIERMKEVNR